MPVQSKLSFPSGHLGRLMVLALVTGAALSTACVARVAPARPAVVVHADASHHPAARDVTVVRVRKAPPPPRREVVVVRPSSRHVWVAGHWTWRRGDWHWVRGAWTVPPRGRTVWVAPRVERRGPDLILIRGRWR